MSENKKHQAESAQFSCIGSGLVFTGSVNAPFLRVAKSVLRTVNLAKPTHSRFKFPAGDGGLCEYTLFHCAVLCDILGRVDWAA